MSTNLSRQQIISVNNTVILGNFHQGSDCFHPELQGLQCTAISVFSLVYAFQNKCDKWSSNDIDNILTDGNSYYIFCLKQAKTQPRYLSVNECLGIIVLDSIEFKIEEYRPYTVNQMTLANLFQQLSDFDTSDGNFSVFVSNLYSFGIIKQNEKLFLFDSHSKDIHGNTSQMGFSSLRCFSDITMLANYFQYHFPNVNEYFEMSFIKITQINTIESI